MNQNPIDEDLDIENITEIDESPVFKEKEIEDFRKIRTQYNDYSVTPPHPHLVDKSVVESETAFNVIGYILTTLGTVLLSIHYTSPDINLEFFGIIYWIIFVLGIVFYIVGKVYLFYKISRGKIKLNEFYDEN